MGTTSQCIPAACVCTMALARTHFFLLIENISVHHLPMHEERLAATLGFSRWICVSHKGGHGKSMRATSQEKGGD
jgi:hypothetical protein